MLMSSYDWHKKKVFPGHPQKLGSEGPGPLLHLEAARRLTFPNCCGILDKICTRWLRAVFPNNQQLEWPGRGSAGGPPGLFFWKIWRP